MYIGALAYRPIPMIEIRKANMNDVPLILQWENDSAIWSITDEPGPFSEEDIEQFILQHNDLLTQGQERWLITSEEKPIGMMDLFEWDIQQRSVGLGIILMHKNDRSNGHGSRSIQMMEEKLREGSGAHSIWVLVWSDNLLAMNFFLKLGYSKIQELFHKGKKAVKFEKKIK